MHEFQESSDSQKIAIFGRFIDLFTCKSAFWKKIRNRGICIWLSGNGTDQKKKLKP